jgi:hypothetical protein
MPVPMGRSSVGSHQDSTTHFSTLLWKATQIKQKQASKKKSQPSQQTKFNIKVYFLPGRQSNFLSCHSKFHS